MIASRARLLTMRSGMARARRGRMDMRHSPKNAYAAYCIQCCLTSDPHGAASRERSVCVCWIASEPTNDVLTVRQEAVLVPARGVFAVTSAQQIQQLGVVRQLIRV